MGLLWIYQIKCFLVSTASVKPLLHTFIKYVIKFFSVEGPNEMLLYCHMCKFSISGKYVIMGCSLEIPSAKWACVKCDYRIYYPPNCLGTEPD